MWPANGWPTFDTPIGLLAQNIEVTVDMAFYVLDGFYTPPDADEPARTT